MATDPHAVTTDDCARQLEADREHLLVLKLAVESLHSRLLAQEDKSKAQAKVIEEQKVLYLGTVREHAKLKGDCTTLQAELQGETRVLREHVDESFKGVLPGLEAHLRPLIVGVTNEAIESKVDLITRDLGKVMQVVGQHEEREKEMAEYLQNVVAPAVGERPAEGRYLVKALEHFELQLETLRENVGALMLSGSSGSVGKTPLERATMDEVVAKFKSFGGKCHCPDVDVMDKRLLALEAQVRGVIASGAPPPAPFGARVPSAGMCTGPFSSGAGCCGAGELIGTVTHPPGIPGGDAAPKRRILCTQK